MWSTPAALCLCLGLVTSAPTIDNKPGDNALLGDVGGDDATLADLLGLGASDPAVTDLPADNALSSVSGDLGDLGATLGNLDSMLDINSTSAEDTMFADMLNDMLDDYDAAGIGGGEGLPVGESSTGLGSEGLEGLAAASEAVASLDGSYQGSPPASSEVGTLDESSAAPAIDTHMSSSDTPPVEGNDIDDITSTGDRPSSSPEGNAEPTAGASSSSPSSSSPSSSSPLDNSPQDEEDGAEEDGAGEDTPGAAAEEAEEAQQDEYDYYADPNIYGDFAPPTAFPFSMFEDTKPRAPARGDILPSSCVWAVVQCCSNPDKMVSSPEWASTSPPHS